ncbi:hypothetical protein Tco_1253131 [Tanacetum coccineum]
MSTSTNTTFEFNVNHNEAFKLNPLTYQDGLVLNINVPIMDFEDMVSYLTRKITKCFTTLYYTLPPNHTLLGMKATKNDYDTNVMYDIAKVVGKLQIYASHHPINLSTVSILNDGSLEKSFAGFIDITKPTTPYTQTIFNFFVHNNGKLVIDDKKDPMYVNGGTMNITIPRMKLEEMKQYLSYILGKKINALYYKLPHNGFSITVKLRNNYDMHVMFDISSAQEMMNHVITDYTSDSEDERRDVTQNDHTFDQMVEWAEQEHFEDKETEYVQR